MNGGVLISVGAALLVAGAALSSLALLCVGGFLVGSGWVSRGSS